MAYYRDSVTEKSWQILQQLKREFKFCLIGGWAVWLYTQKLKSKDIDIIIDLDQLAELRQKYELEKNERLKKYQVRLGEVEIDVYTPYYSDLGIPAEQILANQQLVGGFFVPKPETLFDLKLTAWLGRRGSAKGRKDFIDLVGLWLEQKIDQENVKNKIGINEFIREFKLITSLPELGLNRHQMAKEKSKIAL